VVGKKGNIMSKVVEIELTPICIKKLANGNVINKPMRERSVNNVGIKFKADQFDLLDSLIDAMIESGASYDDIKTAVGEKLNK
jgi:hypothetical protein